MKKLQLAPNKMDHDSFKLRHEQAICSAHQLDHTGTVEMKEINVPGSGQVNLRWDSVDRVPFGVYIG
ncbi:hypothetical protein RP20_CCG027824 [Aedes albopictus]|nr:hypothetical protein RP20_CCG027824 [Aedes albopictus]